MILMSLGTGHADANLRRKLGENLERENAFDLDILLDSGYIFIFPTKLTKTDRRKESKPKSCLKKRGAADFFRLWLFVM